MGTRLSRRSDSWYDSNIVTQQGEDILKNIDDCAIKWLRANRLVWSGWGRLQTINQLRSWVISDTHGCRDISTQDVTILRRFFLSLLWRAAVSSLPDMNETVLPDEDIEALRCFIIGGVSPPLWFYPVQLIQMATLGDIHNQTPILSAKEVPQNQGEPARMIHFYRIYFDGLIVHINTEPKNDGYTERLGQMILGQAPVVSVLTINYEVSFQRENLISVIQESFPNI